jgi:hypothetical protein
MAGLARGGVGGDCSGLDHAEQTQQQVDDQDGHDHAHDAVWPAHVSVLPLSRLPETLPPTPRVNCRSLRASVKPLRGSSAPASLRPFG